MPQPKRAKETEKEYISRCMSDDKMASEYPDSDQRFAICKSKASETIFNETVKIVEDGLGLRGKWIGNKGEFKYKDPVTGEVYFFVRRGIYKKNGRTLVYVSKSSAGDKVMKDYLFQDKEAALRMAEKIGLSDVHSHKSGDNKTLWMPGKSMKEFQDWYGSYNAKI